MDPNEKPGWDTSQDKIKEVGQEKKFCAELAMNLKRENLTPHLHTTNHTLNWSYLYS